MQLAAPLRRFWDSVQEGEPGQRFQDRYHRHKESGARDHPVRRIAKIVGGVALVALGVVEIFFPGPAILFIFVGGGLLATESLTVARAMDWCELRGRQLWRAVSGWWQQASTPARALVIAVVALAAAGAGLAAYRLWLD